MCEIEKATGTTKETINSFWNTKLLFIVPFSVIDDIYNDPTHTLARTTEHTLHHEYAMTMTGMTASYNAFTDRALTDYQYSTHHTSSALRIYHPSGSNAVKGTNTPLHEEEEEEEEETVIKTDIEEEDDEVF